LQLDALADIKHVIRIRFPAVGTDTPITGELPITSTKTHQPLSSSFEVYGLNSG